jgi:uncharacterized repeat protein (TIGR03803 family)
MAKLRGWRVGLVVFILFAATAIAAPAQTFTSLVSFDKTDGANPYTGLVQGRDGNYYGMTTNGGINSPACYGAGCGTIFKITPAGTLTTIYSFCTVKYCHDGASPYLSSLILATDGNFYGTTTYGGSGRDKICAHGLPTGCGTVFKLSSAGALTTLYNFCTQRFCPDGDTPTVLIQATNGNFYGTTQGGGNRGNGTIFKITPGGTLTTLHSIWTNGKDLTGLVQGTDGNLYGIAGGQTGGSVFKITLSGKLTTLYKFCSQSNCTDGDGPTALIQATDGNFYGTTISGGVGGGGTVFKITSAGVLTTLYSFCTQTGCSDLPVALVQATDGNFYGTTHSSGGSNCDPYGCGTLFQVTPAGALTTLYSFCTQTGCSDGFFPGELMQGTNGNFYGPTLEGGASTACNYFCGTVYSLSVGLGPFVSFVRGSGKVGWRVEILGQGFTGTTGVSFNGTAANFVVHSDTYLTATIPQGATTGFVSVTTPGGTLQSNVVFRVTK